MASSESWQAIFDHYSIDEHNFEASPYNITGESIKRATAHFTRTTQREVRTLAYQDSRDTRPEIFKDKGLFILPVTNRSYVIVKGEGYLDIPAINDPINDYKSRLPFELETSSVGNSEMQHLDHAYALSLVRHFVGDDSLLLTIRGKKRTPYFEFRVGQFTVAVDGVQTEVDAGYEGNGQVVLIEAKNEKVSNVIIRQFYYPYRQWSRYTTKRVSSVFFQRAVNGEYRLWQFGFDDPNDYNSIRLLRSGRYRILQDF